MYRTCGASGYCNHPPWRILVDSEQKIVPPDPSWSGASSGQQFSEPGDLVFGDAEEDVGKSRLRVDVVELRGLCGRRTMPDGSPHGAPWCRFAIVDRVHASSIPTGIVWSFRSPPRRACGRSAGSLTALAA
jgi:hypothetical protein